ncbi:MAG: DUF3352 domain-containing protein [Thermomicrobiales bacterium]|nr:DUF3352 domain-containing protein [Thermomicrobiales bacterium]
MTAHPSALDYASDQPEPNRRRTKVIGGFLVGLLALLIVGGGVVLAFRMLLGHDDRATAAYAPQDSVIYVAANTDPTSRAWLNAWQLARNAGIDDDLSRLPQEGLDDVGEDPSLWDDLIRPAIGREVGFAVWQPAGQDGPDVALVVMIADENAAEQAIARILDGETPETRTYRDITYQVKDEQTAVGIVDDAMIVASGSDAFQHVIDARRDGALNDIEQFTSAADRAADDPLLFSYVDGPAITALARTHPDAAQAYGFDASAMQTWSGAGAMTFTVKASGDTLRFATLTGGRPADFPTTATDGIAADDLPASTIFAVAGVDLYESFLKPTIGQATALDAPLSDGSDAADAIAGLAMDDDLLSHLVGSYSFSFAALTDSSSPFGFSGAARFQSDVDDTSAVTSLVNDVADSLADIGVPMTRTDTGFSISGSGVPVFGDVAVDDNLTVGFHLGDGVGDGTLADDSQFADLMDALQDDSTMIGYLALDRLIGLIPEDEWRDVSPQTRAALESLSGMGWSVAPDGDGLSAELLLTVTK